MIFTIAFTNLLEYCNNYLQFIVILQTSSFLEQIKRMLFLVLVFSNEVLQRMGNGLQYQMLATIVFSLLLNFKIVYPATPEMSDPIIIPTFAESK